MALSTFAHQQQIAPLHDPAEVGDRHSVAAVPAPHIGQQALADIGGDGLPALAGWPGEAGE